MLRKWISLSHPSPQCSRGFSPLFFVLLTLFELHFQLMESYHCVSIFLASILSRLGVEGAIFGPMSPRPRTVQSELETYLAGSPPILSSPWIPLFSIIVSVSDSSSLLDGFSCHQYILFLLDLESRISFSSRKLCHPPDIIES